MSGIFNRRGEGEEGIPSRARLVHRLIKHHGPIIARNIANAGRNTGEIIRKHGPVIAKAIVYSLAELGEMGIDKAHEIGQYTLDSFTDTRYKVREHEIADLRTYAMVLYSLNHYSDLCPPGESHINNNITWKFMKLIANHLLNKYRIRMKPKALTDALEFITQLMTIIDDLKKQQENIKEDRLARGAKPPPEIDSDDDDNE